MPGTIYKFSYKSRILRVSDERTSSCLLFNHRKVILFTREMSNEAEIFNKFRSLIKEGPPSLSCYAYKSPCQRSIVLLCSFSRSNHAGTVSAITAHYSPHSVGGSNQRWLLGLRLGQRPWLDLLFPRLLQFVWQETKHLPR